MNSTELTIRNANFADREAANAIHKSAYPDDLYCYANNIGIPGTINLVATKDEGAIGFILVLVNQPDHCGRFLWERMHSYIGFLGVSEAYRQSGIGTALVMEAPRKAVYVTSKDCIYFKSENENEKAQRFYEKIGFKVISLEEIEKTFCHPLSQKFRVYCGEKQLFVI